jgi:hypothetical protein|nr:MAG TPA: putative structural protein [Caudoviricetes sp.]
MAELAKKLQVKSSGTTTSCKFYSTSAEAGTSYVRAKVDNVEAYIPLVDASDGRASKVHIGGKCIATTGKPPYTEQSWYNPGTYIWNVPSGVTSIRYTLAGAGGGGLNVSNIRGNGGNGDLQSATINLAGYGNVTTITITVGKGGQLMTIHNLSDVGYKGGSTTITIGTDTITAEGGGGAYIRGMANIGNGTNAGNGQGGKGGIGTAGENGYAIIAFGGDI